MYLRECLIENVGPISSLDISLNLNAEGNPKPIVLVGKNGTGKTIVLAYILDALAEMAKKKFRDVVLGAKPDHTPYIKITSSGDIRSLSANSLSLLEFVNGEQKICYVEKNGQPNPQDYVQKLRGRFELVKLWPDDQLSHKLLIGDESQIDDIFQNGAVCFFPSSRHERPHWLNDEAVENKPLFSNSQRLVRVLGKPLIVEQSAEINQNWLLDVFLDSLVDGDFHVSDPTLSQPDSIRFQSEPNLQYKFFAKAGRQNLETLLSLVLEDEDTQFMLSYRNAP
jgi:hypothetical protein